MSSAVDLCDNTDTADSFTRRARVLGDANLADYLALCARMSPNGVVADTADRVLFAGGHHYPGAFANGVMRRGADPCGDATLDHAEQFFGQLSRPFSVWIRGEYDEILAAECRGRGYRLREPAAGLRGMAIDAPPTMGGDVPDGFELVEVDSEAGYGDYLDVVGEAWQLGGAPRTTLEAVMFPVSSLAVESMRVFVCYRGERAVAGCSAFVTDRCASLQWTGVRAEAGGHGLGQSCFVRAWAAAFDSGATLVTAQASQVGAPLWSRMGFRTVTHYARYYSPAAARR